MNTEKLKIELLESRVEQQERKINRLLKEIERLERSKEFNEVMKGREIKGEEE